MIRKLASPGAAALVLSLLLATRAAADCVPTWGNTTVVLMASELSLSGRAAADFTGDGRTDLLVASPTALYLAPNVAGQLGASVKVATAPDIANLQAADVNGDGDQDAVTYDRSTNAIVVFPGNGDGTFGAAIQTSTGLDGAVLTAGHFNADGKIDLAFRSSGSAAAGVFLGSGTGTFTSGGSHVAVSNDWRRLLAGDVTGDGLLDVVSHVSLSTKLQIFAGNGDGTLDAPFEITGASNSIHFALGDIDADGDVDLVEIESASKSLMVIRNNGAGTFAAPVPYPIQPSFELASGFPVGLVLSDVTGDGIPEAIVPLTSDGVIATWVAKGDGTFAAPTHSRPRLLTNFTLARASVLLLADVDGDGHTDDLFIATQNGFHHGTLLNGCGSLEFNLTLANRIIAVSQSTSLTLFLSTGSETLPLPPVPTGSVKLFHGTTLVSTSPLDDSGSATLSVSGIPEGTRQLHVRYGGDDRYAEADSQTVQLEVVSDSEIPAISIMAEQNPAFWGNGVRLGGTVTIPEGEFVQGPVEVFRDGVKILETHPFHENHWSAAVDWDRAPGTYQYRVRYTGGTHAPSALSAPLSVEITKAPTSIQLLMPQDVVRAGDTVLIQLATIPDAGTVSLYDGTKLLETQSQSFGRFNFAATFSAGRHTLTARFHETATHAPSELVFDIVSLAQGAAAIDASVVNGTVTVAWAGTILQEWVPNFGWMKVPFANSPYIRPNQVAGALYAFRAVTHDSLGQPVASATDAVVLTSFGNPLAKGMAVKALHVTELVAAINAWRSAVALTPLSIPNAVRGKVIRAADVNALHLGLSGARTAIGMSPLSAPFTPGASKIRAVDLQQLRDLLLR